MKIREVIVEERLDELDLAALGTAAKKTGAAIGNAAKATGNAIIHPIDTAKKAGKVIQKTANFVAEPAANIKRDVSGVAGKIANWSNAADLSKLIMQKWNDYLKQVYQATNSASKLQKNGPQPQTESKRRKIREAVKMLPGTKTPQYPQTVQEFQELLKAWLQNYTGKPLADITGGQEMPATMSTEMLRGYFHNIAKHLIAQKSQTSSEEGLTKNATAKIADEVKLLWEKTKSTTENTTVEEYITQLLALFDKAVEGAKNENS